MLFLKKWGDIMFPRFFAINGGFLDRYVDGAAVLYS